MSLSWLLFLLLISCNEEEIYGWGVLGHGLVVRLAQTQLNGSEYNWLRELVPWHHKGNLSAMASWPDYVLYESYNPSGYENWLWSKGLHYVSFPDWNCSYVPERDCPEKRCIEDALNNYTQRLVAPYDEKIDYIQRQEALFFLIHFVGDVHQPLHVSFKGDLGGSELYGYFMNGTQPINLHIVWDTAMVTHRLHESFQSDVDRYFDYLYSLMMNQSLSIKDNDATDFKVWMQESADAVCSQVYLNDDNQIFNSSFNLGQAYFDRSWPLIDQRIAQGGHRLASLLKRLTMERSISHS